MSMSTHPIHNLINDKCSELNQNYYDIYTKHQSTAKTILFFPSLFRTFLAFVDINIYIFVKIVNRCQ